MPVAKQSRSLITKVIDRIKIDKTDQENARCFSRINHASGESCSGTDGDKPVLFFNASTRLSRLSLNAAFEWLTANCLQFDGVRAHFLVCMSGLVPCLLSVAYDEDPCKRCMALSQKMYDGLDTTALSFVNDKTLANAVEGCAYSELENFCYQNVPLGQLVLPSLRWILRRWHLADDPQAVLLFRQFIRSAWSVYVQAEETINRLQPRAVVVFNGLQYPEAVVKYVGKKHGIPTYTHEIGLMPFTAIFTEGEATACPIDLPDDFVMTEERDERLNQYLSMRMGGKFSTAGIQFWPEMESLSPEFWELARTFKQIVPVFTNVVFDTSQAHANTIFAEMFDWLDEVRKLIEHHTDTLFVVRAHPDELRRGKESHETVTQWIQKTQLLHLPNVLYIEPDQYISSYELIRNAKFVMVYNSTIGLEAAIMGAVVLCGGRSRYTQVPLAYLPADRVAFTQKAEELLSADEVQAPPEFQQTARRFMYYQFFHCALSFEEFIEPDAVWQGYVKIKAFPEKALSAAQNVCLQVIEDGILNNQPFVLPHREDEPEK